MQLQVEITNKQILKIALPISLALMVPQLNFIINNIFLGHFSEQALATASITGVYYLVFASIGFGLNNGLQALIARRAGENRPEAIGSVFNQGILISLLIAAMGTVITYFVAPPILKASLHSATTYQMAVEFLHIRIWGLPFLYLYQMSNALLVSTNQSKYLVAGTLAEAGANIFFDYILIFGKMGLPVFGFNGAAIASILAEFSGMFIIFLVMYRKGIKSRFSLFQNMKWDRHHARIITNISGPLVFQHAISIISWVFFYILIEHHGTTSMAVSNTMRNVFGFFGVFIWGFASATNSMVSNVIGQGKKEIVITLINKIAYLSIGFTGIVALLVNLFPENYLSIYGQSEEFIRAGTPVLRLVAAIMVLMSVSSIWLNAVTGTGNSRITFFIEVAGIIVYCIYVYFVLEVKRLSIFWGWSSELLYWSCMLVLSFFYIRSGRWRLKKI